MRGIAAMKAIRITVQPATLKLARERAGYGTITEAVEQVSYLSNLSHGKHRLEGWESGHEDPTLPAAKQLAKSYGVPYPFFYLKPEVARKHLPDIRKTLVDFRSADDASCRQPNVIGYLRNITKKQSILRNIIEKEDIPDLSWIGKHERAPHQSESIKSIANELIKKLWDKNDRYDRRRQLQDWVRQAEDNLGVTVMQHSLHKTQAGKRPISGLALADDRVPLVALLPSDTPERRKFTLLHGLAHLMIKQPGLSNLGNESEAPPHNNNKIEKFCNAIAAQALMPEDEFRKTWGTQENDTAITSVKKKFGSSPSACVVRAHALKLLSQEGMLRKLASYSKKFEERPQQPGGFPTQSSLAIRRVGKAMARKALLAFDAGQLTLNDLYDIFEVKLNHLNEIAGKVGYSLMAGRPEQDS